MPKMRALLSSRNHFMSRSKVNHTKQKQKNPIQNELDSFRSVAYSLSVLLLTMNKNDVHEVETLLSDYQQLSNNIDHKNNLLSSTQKNQVKEIRKIITPEQRQELRRKLKFYNEEISKEEARQKRQIDLKDQSMEQARKKVAELMPALVNLKINFLKIDLNHSATIEHELKEYKNKRAEIAEEISKLDDSERIERSEELRLISIEINKHYSKICLQIESARKAIRKVVGDTSKKVDQMTFGQAVLTLLPDATQGTVVRLEESAQLLRIMEDQGGQFVRDQLQIGDLSLSLLPLNTQTTLISVLNQELLKSASDERAGVVAGFIRAIQNDMQALIEGKKTHLSVIYEVNGEISSLHIGLLSLLNDPTTYIAEIAMAMLRQGVREQNRVVMTLSSPHEVSALMHLNGENVEDVSNGKSLQYLTGQVMGSAGNALALTSVVHKEVVSDELMRRAISISKENPPTHIQLEQLFDLTKIALILIGTRHTLISPPERLGNEDAQILASNPLPLMTLRSNTSVVEDEVDLPSHPVVIKRDLHPDMLTSSHEQMTAAPKQQVNNQERVVALHQESPSEEDSRQLDVHALRRQRDNQRYAQDTIRFKKQDLARKVVAYNQKVQGITSDLENLDALYYQNDSNILIRDEFKKNILKAIKEYRNNLSLIIQKNYQYDAVQLNNDINRAGDIFLNECSMACNKVVQNDSFDYELGLGDYLTDFMKLVANLVIWVGNSLPYRTNRNQFFDYANSKSANAQFVSIQQTLQEIDVQHSPR
jgi:hypothetical protein